MCIFWFRYYYFNLATPCQKYVNIFSQYINFEKKKANYIVYYIHAEVKNYIFSSSPGLFVLSFSVSRSPFLLLSPTNIHVRMCLMAIVRDLCET